MIEGSGEWQNKIKELTRLCADLDVPESDIEAVVRQIVRGRPEYATVTGGDRYQSSCAFANGDKGVCWCKDCRWMDSKGKMVFEKTVCGRCRYPCT